jgi:6-phosphofructokinase 1
LVRLSRRLTAVQYFREEEKRHVSVRFIDPSYMIRSVPARSDDSIYCMLLASQAVHGTAVLSASSPLSVSLLLVLWWTSAAADAGAGAMAGLTGFTVGLINNRTVYIPNDLLKDAKPKRVNSVGRMWERVLMMTRQPRFGADAARVPSKPGDVITD